jgi:hypothetical protein
MDSGEIAQGELGIEGMTEFDEETQNEDRYNFLDEF